jgi:hypothetical protein
VCFYCVHIRIEGIYRTKSCSQGGGGELVGLHRKRPEPITLPLLCVYVQEAIIREFFSGAAITNLNLVFLKVMETDLMLYIFREYNIPQCKIPQ